MELTTLILSHNEIEDIKGLEKMKHITKLSLSHNKIHVIINIFDINNTNLKEIKGIKHLADLKELKLNDNKIMALPDVLKENVNLEIFDIGNNEINDLK